MMNTLEKINLEQIRQFQPGDAVLMDDPIKKMESTCSPERKAMDILNNQLENHFPEKFPHQVPHLKN